MRKSVLFVYVLYVVRVFEILYSEVIDIGFSGLSYCCYSIVFSEICRFGVF